jgi:hypothetical protein
VGIQPDRPELPEKFDLLPAFPNPFNPTTAFSFRLPAADYVQLDVLTTAGKLVAAITGGWCEAGTYQITFNGSGLPSGIYIYRLQSGEDQASGKMVLLK